MNLQVNSPYKKCPYRCPFCVAGIEDKQKFFSDLFYEVYPMRYAARLISIVKEYNIDTVVITGSTEPTLFPEWIKLVVETVRPYVRQIEIQTRNYTFMGMEGIDVVAYSYSEIPAQEHAPVTHGIMRNVFVYNDTMTPEELIYFWLSSKNLSQITVKQMVKSSYGVAHIDEYISAHKKEITESDKHFLEYFNIQVDMDCSVSEDRYIIYRTDGNLYQHWSDLTPIKGDKYTFEEE